MRSLSLGEESNPQTFDRLQRIARWLAFGTETVEIARRAKELWGISDRQTRNYVKRASEMIRSQIEAQEAAHRNRHLVCRQMLALEAWEAGDFGNAIKSLDSEAKLLGLFERASGAGDGSISATELAAELDAFNSEFESQGTAEASFAADEE